jgi:hypothetical protein
VRAHFRRKNAEPSKGSIGRLTDFALVANRSNLLFCPSSPEAKGWGRRATLNYRRKDWTYVCSPSNRSFSLIFAASSTSNVRARLL